MTKARTTVEFDAVLPNNDIITIPKGTILIYHFETRSGFHFAVPLMHGTGSSGVQLFGDEFEWLEGELIESDEVKGFKPN